MCCLILQIKSSTFVCFVNSISYINSIILEIHYLAINFLLFFTFLKYFLPISTTTCCFKSMFISGRNPVSIYKLNESNRDPNVELKIEYPLHNRRRVTPSLGSVQRARNLGSHAQIFNQSIAPPHWGPQKVDHSIYLPAMAQKI